VEVAAGEEGLEVRLEVEVVAAAELVDVVAGVAEEDAEVLAEEVLVLVLVLVVEVAAWEASWLKFEAKGASTMPANIPIIGSTCEITEKCKGEEMSNTFVLREKSSGI